MVSVSERPNLFGGSGRDTRPIEAVLRCVSFLVAWLQNKMEDMKQPIDERVDYYLKNFLQCFYCGKLKKKPKKDGLVPCSWCGGTMEEYHGMRKCVRCSSDNLRKDYNRDGKLIREYCIKCGFNKVQ